MGFSRQWDDKYQDNTHLSIWPWTDLVSLVMRNKPQKRNFKVLELGCGAGANIPLFVSLEADYFTVEGSKTIVDKLHQRFPHLKDEIPLFIIFKAFGYINDKEIINFIVDDKDISEYIELLRPSILEVEHIRTKEQAIDYLKNYISIKYTTIEKIFNKDILEHLGNSLKKKACLIGYMTKLLLDAIYGYEKYT